MPGRNARGAWWLYEDREQGHFSALLQFKRKWSPQAHVLELGLKTVVPFWRVVGLADSGTLLDEVGLEVL